MLWVFPRQTNYDWICIWVTLIYFQIIVHDRSLVTIQFNQGFTITRIMIQYVLFEWESKKEKKSSKQAMLQPNWTVPFKSNNFVKSVGKMEVISFMDGLHLLREAMHWRGCKSWLGWVKLEYKISDLRPGSGPCSPITISTLFLVKYLGITT